MDIVITILGITALIFYYYVKAMAQKAKDANVLRPSSTSLDDFETLFGGIEASTDGDDDSKREMSSNPFETFERHDYFTYETMEEPQHEDHKSKRKKKSERREVRVDAPVLNESVDEGSALQFDLRQAVIAQTILHNDYIDEIYTR